MRFLYDYIVAIQVALVCAAYAWLFGGSIAGALTPTIPWLFVFLLEMMICFPQRHAGESTYEARQRVWRKMGKDPLVWIVVGFTLMMMVPFFNVGLCPVCDYPAIHFDGMPEAAPVAFIPFCVNRAEHLNVVMWFIPSLVAMLAVKHSLLKRGKRKFLELMVWNGFALSLVGMIQAATSAQAPLWSGEPIKTYFFSTFGYPNMAGDYFTTLFGIAFGLWRWNVEEDRKTRSEREKESNTKSKHTIFWQRHLMLVPTVVFFFSSLMTLSRAAILFTVAMAIIFFFHTIASFMAHMNRAKRVKAIAVNIIVLVLISTLFFVFMSDRVRSQIAQGRSRDITDSAKPAVPVVVEKDLRDDFEKEVKTIDTRGVIDRIAGQDQSHVRVATAVWKDHPFFGCGGWGYSHFTLVKMTDAEYAKVQVTGGANVHNDYMQFLAEHGAVGVLLLASIVVLLVVPVVRVWKAMIASVRFIEAKRQPPKPVSLFILPAPAFAIFVTAIATMIHALGDCPLRSPAVLSLFFTSLAAIDGFMPKLKDQK